MLTFILSSACLIQSSFVGQQVLGSGIYELEQNSLFSSVATLNYEVAKIQDTISYKLVIHNKENHRTFSCC